VTPIRSRRLATSPIGDPDGRTSASAAFGAMWNVPLAGETTIRQVGVVSIWEASPCFSPDGSRIVFTSDAAGGPQLYIIPANGGTMQRVATNISGYCAEPDWSRANPNKIAFTTRIGRGYQIAVHDFSKGKSAQVSNARFDGVEPSWLPDGRHLVYTARDQRTSVLCILDTESGASVPISPASFGPAFQANVWAK